MSYDRERSYIIKEIEKINVVRKSVGLTKIIYGELKCLFCGKLFFSVDTKKNKLCEACCNLNQFKNN